MIVIALKSCTICNWLKDDHSVACSPIVAGWLAIIAIMVSHIPDETSVHHQFHYIYYKYDISKKPRIVQWTKVILNPITDTIPNINVTSHPLPLYFD